MKSIKARIKLFLPIVLMFFSLYFVYSMLHDKVDLEYNATFDYECIENGSLPSPHILHYCIQGPRIFFVETSQSQKLTARQICAVESTARNNPGIGVTLLMTAENGPDYSDELLSSLKLLPNVQIRTINIDVFVHGTPIWIWYRVGKWKRSKYKVSHLSDALRFLIVWKYGGMYLDLDIVTLRSLEHLKNSVVTENWDRVASGILIFGKGHDLMLRSMTDFAKNYNSRNFVYNGPGVISRNIREYCDIKDISKVSGADCDVNILPPDAAFPIVYDEWLKYFEPSNVQNVTAHFSSSFMIHVWNKYSSNAKLKIGTNSLYEKAIREHCPMTYSFSKKLKYI